MLRILINFFGTKNTSPVDSENKDVIFAVIATGSETIASDPPMIASRRRPYRICIPRTRIVIFFFFK